MAVPGEPGLQTTGIRGSLCSVAAADRVNLSCDRVTVNCHRPGRNLRIARSDNSRNVDRQESPVALSAKLALKFPRTAAVIQTAASIVAPALGADPTPHIESAATLREQAKAGRKVKDSTFSFGPRGE
jgi:hypothetical protein